MSNIIEFENKSRTVLNNAKQYTDELDSKVQLFHDFGADKSDSNIVNAITETGGLFQKMIAENPMDGLNSNVGDRQLQKRLWQIYTTYGEGYVFDILMLRTPAHEYNPKISLRAENIKTMPHQFMAKAWITREVINNQYRYIVWCKVLGADVNHVLDADLAGLSTAAAIAAKAPVSRGIVLGLSGECQGSQVRNIQDIDHVSKIVTLYEESQRGGTVIFDSLSKAAQKDLQHSSVQEVAHLHTVPVAKSVSVARAITYNTTALNPLRESPQDIVRLDDLKNEFVIIPVWEQLQKTALHPDYNSNNSQNKQSNEALAIQASIALGLLSSIGERGIEDLQRQVIEPMKRGNVVPISQVHKVN